MKWVITTITGIIVTLAMFFYAAENNKQPKYDWIEESYIVSEGDTLWSICEEHCGDLYILEYIEEVKAHNDDDISTIYIGQEITILREAN